MLAILIIFAELLKIILIIGILFAVLVYLVKTIKTKFKKKPEETKREP